MNLDLSIYLPTSNINWKISNNIIYYHKYVDIPVLSIKNEVIWVSLDRRITNPILDMVKHLMNNDIRFYFTKRTIIHNSDVFEEDLSDIIKTYLIALTDEKFFDLIFDIGFDYIENLTNFMIDYNCHELFKEPFEEIKGEYLPEMTEWYTNKKYYKIKKEYIRDFIATLEREIKLNMLI